MKLDRKTLQLYAITDRTWLDDRKLQDDVQKAIDGGITFLQMREKSLSTDDFIKEALAIKELAQTNDIPLVINDDIDVAIKVDADGVHIGQDDIAVSVARKMLGTDKILGVSAHTLEQALKAQKDGADYIGVGAVFNTSTKSNASNVSISTLREICDNISIPVVTIGGITADNALKLQGTGVSGICVISAIFGSSDINGATNKLRRISKQIIDS